MKWMKLGNKPWKNEGFYNLQVFLSDQSPNIALPCRKSLNRWPCWDLTESVPLVLWLSKSRNLSLPCTQLWQLKPADDSFGCCSKLSTVLTAVTSYQQFWQFFQSGVLCQTNSSWSFTRILNNNELNSGFVKVVTWICQKYYIYVSLFTKQNQPCVWPWFWG